MSTGKTNGGPLNEVSPELADWGVRLTEATAYLVAGDQNDRSMVIVGAAHTEALLEDLLVKCLLPVTESPNALKKDVGGRPSFPVKARLSVHVGVISREMYKSLLLFNTLRNHFAHTMKASLEDAKAQGILKELRERYPLNRIATHGANSMCIFAFCAAVWGELEALLKVVTPLEDQSRKAQRLLFP